MPVKDYLPDYKLIYYVIISGKQNTNSWDRTKM